MNDMLIVIFFSLIGGLFSLIAGVILLADRKRANRLLKYVTPFAAGALLAAVFMDVLPEAIQEGSIETALQWTLVGIIGFLVLERIIKWFHRHNLDHSEGASSTAPLIIIGDTVHNFLDGIAIAAAFLIDVPTGIIVTLAVAAHEIPQEFGDFGLLLDKGMSRRKVITANILSSLATTVAAVGFYAIGREADVSLGIALGLVAGFFIYIAVSDIIPSIRATKNQKLASTQIAILIFGVLMVSLVTNVLHGAIDTSDTQEATNYHDEHEHEDEH